MFKGSSAYDPSNYDRASGEATLPNGSEGRSIFASVQPEVFETEEEKEETYSAREAKQGWADGWKAIKSGGRSYVDGRGIRHHTNNPTYEITLKDVDIKPIFEQVLRDMDEDPLPPASSYNRRFPRMGPRKPWRFFRWLG